MINTTVQYWVAINETTKAVQWTGDTVEVSSLYIFRVYYTFYVSYKSCTVGRSRQDLTDSWLLSSSRLHKQ